LRVTPPGVRIPLSPLKFDAIWCQLLSKACELYFHRLFSFSPIPNKCI
jgi:hypothetical protein